MVEQINKLTTNSIIKDKNKDKRYRILYFQSKEEMVVIELDTTKFNVFYQNPLEIMDKVLLGELELEEVKTNSVLNLDSLNQKQKDTYYNKLQFVYDVEQVYGPTFILLSGKGAKLDFVNITQKYGYSKSSAWRIIRKYLQSGCDKTSLIYQPSKIAKNQDGYKAKTGRKTNKPQGIIITEDVKKQFDEMIRLYRKNKAYSFQILYDKLCSDYYSVHTEEGFKVLPASQRPTLRQFYYYCSKHITKDEMIKIKTSNQEFRNNNRLLFGESSHNATGPGTILEMDAQEMDVAIVSEYDSSQVIGRPILYGLIDVYSKAIVAVSIGFDNNSLVGMTNCLLNLAEDKNSYVTKNGLPEINLDFWPSNFYPKCIRVDRGSDFVSKEAERIFNELNIQREIVPGASGSLKGCIEQLWHQLNSTQIGELYGKGLIEKRYDSTHYKKAVLTMKEVTQIVITQTIAYNQTLNKNYRLTKEMVKDKIKPCPYEIWKYGVKKYGMPTPIINKNDYAYTLMTKPRATISKRGVCIDGLYYISEDADFLQMCLDTGSKKEKFNCRYDVRDITNVYYLEKNQLKTLSLNLGISSQQDFIGSTKQERLDFLKNVKENLKQMEEENQTIRSARQGIIESITKKAKSNSTNTELKTKNIKQHRSSAQKQHQKENSISKVLDIDNQSTNSLDNVNTEENTKTTKQSESLNYEEYYKDYDPIQAQIDAIEQFELDEMMEAGLTFKD